MDKRLNVGDIVWHKPSNKRMIVSEIWVYYQDYLDNDFSDARIVCSYCDNNGVIRKQNFNKNEIRK